MAAKKYNHLVLDDFVRPPMTMPPQNSPYLAGTPFYWKLVPGAVGQFAFYYIMRPGMFAEPPHKHNADEYLMFISSNPRDMKSLGAMVEIAFGEEWEKYTFDYSTFVYFPKGVVHCPVHVRKLERPFFLGHFWPGGEPAHFDNQA